MGLDENIVSVMREVVQFLETLGNVELPTTINNLRENLLTRSKMAIHKLSTRESLSTEAYLDMRVGKGFPLVKSPELEEYVGAEIPQSEITKDDYESFAEVQEEPTMPVTNNTSKNSSTEKVFSIYKSFSVEQAKSASVKYGPLEHKEKKKFFLFDQYRNCWAGLVGTHLLLYTSAYRDRPFDVLPLRGYNVRPAPNAVQRKNEAAFEIFSPGKKTMLFVARTEKDMEQWVAAIYRVGCSENDLERQSMMNYTSEVKEANSDVVTNESKSVEKLQDVNTRRLTTEGTPKRSATTEQNAGTKKENRHVSPTKDTFKNDDTPPPLPSRIPCTFLAMPHKSNVHSFDTADDTNQSIYEDIKEYVNIPKRQISKTVKDDDIEVYDDAQSVAEEARGMEKPDVQEKKISTQKAVKDLETEDTYDDAFSRNFKSNDRNENSQKQEPMKSSSDVIRHRLSKVSNDRDSSYYDDAHGVAVPRKSKKEIQKTKEEGQSSPVRTLQKKSFLDRMRNRRDSPQKEDERYKPTLAPTPTNLEDVSTYDDIANLKAINSSIKPGNNTPIEMETSEYNFPPPPEAIYNSPTVANAESELEEKFYMNVDDSQENGMEHHNDETVQWDMRNQKVIKKNNKAPLAIINKEELLNSEHYQAPNNNPVASANQNDEVEENLYDEVAIVREKVRQTRLAIKEQEKASGNKTNVLPSPEKPALEKTPWNRFIVSKKHKGTEESNLETNKKPNDQVTTPEEGYDDCFSLTNNTNGVRESIHKVFKKFA